MSESMHMEQHTSSKESQTLSLSDHQTVSGASSTWTSEPYQVMVRFSDELITALSPNPLGIAGILLAKGLIPEKIEAQMQQPSAPREKATILVTAVTQRIKISPKQFHDFLNILSE